MSTKKPTPESPTGGERGGGEIGKLFLDESLEGVDTIRLRLLMGQQC